MNSVCSDHEVVVVAEAVDGDLHAAVLDSQCLGALPPSHRNVVHSRQQEAMQIRPRQGHAGAYSVPEVNDVDLEEQASVPVGCPLAPDVDGTFGDPVPDAYCGEGADRVSWQIEPGAFLGWCRVSVDDLDLGAPVSQGASGGETSDPSPDHQYLDAVAAHWVTTRDADAGAASAGRDGRDRG